MRKKLIILLIFLLLIIAPSVIAYTNDFQQGDVGDIVVIGDGADLTKYPQSEYQQVWIGTPAVTFESYIHYISPQAATNWSAVISDYTGGPMQFAIFKFYRDGTYLDYFFDANFTSLTPNRYDITLDTSDMRLRLYLNNEFKQITAPIAQTPNYFWSGGYFGGHIHVLVDDYIISPSPDADRATRNHVETLPYDYYVVLDTLNPGNNGLYNGSGIINSGYYWNKISTVSNETKLEEVVNVGTGVVYDQLGIARCVNETRWNISAIAATGAPSGLYKFQWNEPGYGVHSSDPFWIAGYGASIAWDSDKYALGATSTVSWTILPAYYDTATYDYTGKIVDAYGTTKKTWVIPAVSGFETTTLDSTTYPQGTYFAVIVKTLKAAPYTETIMISDYAEVISDVIIQGGTYLNTSVSLPHTVVNITQSGTTTTHTSTPLFNQTGMNPNIVINLTAIYPPGAKWFIPLEITPPSWGIYTVNLYATPDLGNISRSGNNTIFGFVQDSGLFQPVSDAIINIQNATHYSATTANVTGFYNFTGLAEDTIYTLWASSTGYANSTNYNVNSTTVINAHLFNATRQDIAMESRYDVRIYAKDADSLAYLTIPVAFSSTTGTTTQTSTSSTSYANFSCKFALYQFAASAEGYNFQSTTAVISGDREITLYLDSTEEIGGATVYSTPKYVAFHVTEGWGTPVDGVLVNITPVSTSTGMWDWIATLAGIPLEEVPINATSLEQTTDSDGIVAFYIIPTAKYNVSFVKTGYLIPSMVKVFTEDKYEVYATNLTTPSTGSFLINATDELKEVNVTITTGPTGIADIAWLNVTYVDATGNTIGGYINVTQKSSAPFGMETTLAHNHVTASYHRFDLQVTHTQQVNGQIYVNVTHSDFGQIRRSYVWGFNSIPVDFLGFDANMKMLVAFGIMLLTAMLGGAASARAVSLAVCIEGWFFYAIHMFENLTTRGIASESILVLGLVFMTVFTLAINVDLRLRRERR